MKYRNYIAYIGVIASLLACSSEEKITPVYTVGEENNAITLFAGVNESSEGVATRAAEYGNHDKHLPFTEGTKIALRVDGLWTGHSPSDIKKKTVATLGAESAQGSKHNNLTAYSPVIYWDDYGTADPANAATGRTQGLTIYGAAINGATTLPNSLSSLTDAQSTWTGLTWTVETDQTGGIAGSDLLTSNNVVYNADNAKDNAYKFANKNDGKLLEFTHAMSKMTVVLKAGEGFPGYTTSPADAKFESDPTVTLKSFYTTGTVNIEAKTSTATESTKNNIQMRLSDGGQNQNTATFEAIVFPGKSFVDADVILSLTADGNSFNVSAAKLNAAITQAITNKATTGYPANSGDLALKQAWNYKLTIIVNKTDLKVEATIANWNDVQAQEDKPEIAINETYGHDGTAFTHDFDFFRSTAKASGYSKAAYVGFTSPSTYTFHDQLYWPDHQTHYFFRGLYPRVGSETGLIPSANVTGEKVTVQNAAYAVGTYPSDLAMGWPRTDNDAAGDETCKVHTSTQGICATEGKITMNFRFVMSKVQISLKSSGTDAAGNLVDLSNVKVEIIGGYNTGRIQFSDGKHDTFTESDKATYELHKQTTAQSGFSVTTLDAIVPQTLGNDVKLRITVTNSDHTTDVYETQLNKIKVKTTDTLINEWKPGNFYKYELDILKTGMKVAATITDWVTVNASDNVWF